MSVGEPLSELEIRGMLCLLVNHSTTHIFCRHLKYELILTANKNKNKTRIVG